MITEGSAARKLSAAADAVPEPRDLPAAGSTPAARGARDQSSPAASGPAGTTAPVTLGYQPRPRPGAGIRAGRALSELVSGDPLLDAQPPSVRALWRWHIEEAAVHDGALWRSCRQAWGVMDVTTTAVIYVLLWIKRHPVMTAATAVLVTVIALRG